MKQLVLGLSVFFGAFSFASDASATAQCSAVAQGPVFSWGGGTALTIKVTCDEPVAQINITNGQYLINYDNPSVADISRGGFSKTCTNVATCTLSMAIGFPYGSFTSVTTWSANASWPTGSSTPNGLYDPWP